MIREMIQFRVDSLTYYKQATYSRYCVSVRLHVLYCINDSPVGHGPSTSNKKLQRTNTRVLSVPSHSLQVHLQDYILYSVKKPSRLYPCNNCNQQRISDCMGWKTQLLLSQINIYVRAMITLSGIFAPKKNPSFLKC